MRWVILVSFFFFTMGVSRSGGIQHLYKSPTDIWYARVQLNSGPSVASVQAGKPVKPGEPGEPDEPDEVWGSGITAGFPGSRHTGSYPESTPPRPPAQGVPQPETDIHCFDRISMVVADIVAPMSLRLGPRPRSARCRTW